MIRRPPLDPEVARSLEELLKNEADLSFKRRVPIMLRFLDPQADDLILDCGCGMGFNLRTLSELFECRLVGVERNPETLKRTRAELRNTRVRIVRGDALNLPFPDHTFGKILMTEVLEHIPDEPGALHEIRRVLQPGGTLAMSVPNRNYPLAWDPLNRALEAMFHTHVPSHIWWLAGIWADHVRLYTTQQISQALLAGGFEVDEVVPITHYCLPFHHFLVYGVGKNLLQKGLLPASIATSADRFRSRENEGSLRNPMNVVHRMLSWVDSRNEDLADQRLTYVNIAVRAHRPA